MTGWLRHNGVGLHWREDGDPDGGPVLFLNSLGTDLRLWDAIVALLPKDLRLIRMDTRGHGLSDTPEGPYSIEMLAGDAEALIDHLALSHLTVVGVSLGGMVAQALAVVRPGQVEALVLSNTATRMGSDAMWTDRIAAVESGGIAAIAEGILDRWFAAKFRKGPDIGMWQNMLTRTPPEGYAACCAALAKADLGAATPKINQSTLVIAGSDDGASPPDLVRHTASMIPGARYAELCGVGHLPMVEAPEKFAALLHDFFKKEPAHA